MDDVNDRPYRDQVFPVPKTGPRGDCDSVKRVSKAGPGNDRVWKAWKAKKPAFHPSHTPWKSLRDYHIPTASTAGIFEGQEHERPNPRPLDLKEVVIEVLGPKCNGCSGTLTPEQLLGPGVAGQEQAPQRWGAEDASMTGG
jgi:hypothetical protein